MKARTALLLTMTMVAPATLAFADDGSVPSSKTVITTAPPAEFSPVTDSERFRNYLGGLTSAESVLRAMGSAAIHQAEGVPKEWGGGAEGYGFRVGDAMAKHVIRGTIQYGLSAALHEDNRYFASGETGVLKRIKYAVKGTFLVRRDNGEQRLSLSRIGGAAGVAFISRAWQPRSTTSAGDGAVSFGVSMGSDVGFNLLREFVPALRHPFHKE